MNEEDIEALLRKAPGVKTPEGLFERLRRDVKLVRSPQRQSGTFEPRSWLRNWLPALSFAAFFFACLVAVGVQTNLISQLKHETEPLRAASQNLAQLRTDNKEYQRLLGLNQESDWLHKDNQELQNLRAEVAKLRAQVGEVTRLRAANQNLAFEVAANPAMATAGDGDFFDEARAKAEKAQCINNLKQLGLAARVWAGDNNDIFPTNFISMTNEIGNWRILQCPTDKSRNVTNWAEVASGNVSYQMLAPGISENEDPNIVFDFCPIHHIYGLHDGSVQSLDAEGMKHLKVINGRTIFAP